MVNVKKLPEKSSQQSSLLLIVIGNIIPLLGVIFFGWNIGEVIILYWIESLIIGFLNIPRILFAGKSKKSEKISMSIFFMIHYGIFGSVP